MFLVISYLSGARGNWLAYNLWKKYPDCYNIVANYGGRRFNAAKKIDNWHEYTPFYKDIFFNSGRLIDNTTDLTAIVDRLQNHTDNDLFKSGKFNLIVTHNHSYQNILAVQRCLARANMCQSMILRIRLTTLEDRITALTHYYNNLADTNSQYQNSITVGDLVHTYLWFESCYSGVHMPGTLSVDYCALDIDSVHSQIQAFSLTLPKINTGAIPQPDVFNRQNDVLAQAITEIRKMQS